MTDKIDTETIQQRVRESLKQFEPIVQWDRFAGNIIDMVVFGWITRDDGKFDFLAVDLFKGKLQSFRTSSAKYSAHFSKMLGWSHSDCNRVEDYPEVFGDIYCVKLKKETTNAGYKPVAVSVAKYISRVYDKSIVIINTWDSVHRLLHTTTYGKTLQQCQWAAKGGEIAAAALGADLSKKQVFEDLPKDKMKKIISELNRMRKENDENYEKRISGAQYTNGRQHQLDDVIKFLKGMKP